MHREYIEQRNGGYYVAGTRISLDSIVFAFNGGDSPEHISDVTTGVVHLGASGVAQPDPSPALAVKPPVPPTAGGRTATARR